MVNYWQELVQRKQQKEMLTKLKSGEVTVKDGKVIVNQTWIKKKRHREKQAEQKWQAWWSPVEARLEAAFKWKEESV